MPGNYSAVHAFLYVDYNPDAPDHHLHGQDLVVPEGASCPTCPMLEGEGLPTYIRKDSRGQYASVLCPHMQSSGFSMARGCAATNGYCDVSGLRANTGLHGVLPVKVFDRNTAEDRSRRQEERKEWDRKADLSRLTPKELGELADETAAACVQDLTRTLDLVQRAYANMRNLPLAQQIHLTEQLLSLRHRTAGLTGRAA